jgi:hypothetical protein
MNSIHTSSKHYHRLVCISNLHLLTVWEMIGLNNRALSARNILSLNKRHLPVVDTSVLDLLKADSRNKALGLPCLANLGVQLIDLFERKTLGFVDHSPDEEDTDEAASAPDEEDLGSDVGVARSGTDEVGSRVCDSPVKKPVGGGGHGQGLCANLQWEDFSSDNPCAGSKQDISTYIK